MAGNVCEWCWDWYADNVGTGTVSDPCGTANGARRILRGGGYFSGAYNCASSIRRYDTPDKQYTDTGFRVCRSIR